MCPLHICLSLNVSTKHILFINHYIANSSLEMRIRYGVKTETQEVFCLSLKILIILMFFSQKPSLVFFSQPICFLTHWPTTFIRSKTILWYKSSTKCQMSCSSCTGIISISTYYRFSRPVVWILNRLGLSTAARFIVTIKSNCQ